MEKQGKVKISRKSWSKGWLWLTDLIYPPRCPFCENILSEAEKEALVCDSCREKLPYVEENHCMKCGRPLLSEQEEYCRDCRKYKPYFQQGRSVFAYATPVRQSLYRMKNANRQEYIRFYGKEMNKMLGTWIQQIGTEVIIPVPMYPKRKRIRGYNQAELLAAELGKQTGLPVAERLLIKRKDTHAQKSLDARGRRQNLRDAFAVNYQFEGERILLVDDIYTTGATLDAASRALLEAGAGAVYVISVAIGGMG